MFLLVPAHPGFPGQISQSRKTVVCVCVDEERFVVVQPYLTFSICCQLETSQSSEVQKMANIWGFHHPSATE